MKDEVLDYLRTEPRFRERANKDRGIVNLLLSKYKTLLSIPKETLIAFIQDANSMDRCWRKSTADYPELRGKDYDKKKILSQMKQIELGYQPMHHQISKEIKKMV